MRDETMCEHGYGIKQGPCPICDSANDIRGDLYCTHCRMPIEVCSVGLCPGRFTKPVRRSEL